MCVLCTMNSNIQHHLMQVDSALQRTNPIFHDPLQSKYVFTAGTPCGSLLDTTIEP